MERVELRKQGMTKFVKMMKAGVSIKRGEVGPHSGSGTWATFGSAGVILRFYAANPNSGSESWRCPTARSAAARSSAVADDDSRSSPRKPRAALR
jgi:hypothetical protein